MISKKQRAVLLAIRDLPKYMGRESIMCIPSMPESVWFAFTTENAAYAWVRRMEDRGLITIEQDHFMRLTEAGKQAIA